MITGKVRSGFAGLMLICLFNSSCKGAERNSANGRDTSVLAANEQSFTIGTDRAFYQAELRSTGKKLSAEQKVFLWMDAPSVAQNPDGVYEVYITPEKSDVKMFSSSHPGFVNVLDLYILTGGAVPSFLSVDLTKKMQALGKAGHPLPPLFVTILFRGNSLPGNVESKQAGQLSLEGIRVVQEK